MWQRIKNIYHLLISILWNVWFRFPANNLTVIGVTGTDGKTTTASLIYHILLSSGKKVALVSTIGAYIDGEKYDIGFHVTTPSSFGLLRLINRARGSEYLVLEVTSHALDQERVWGIPFAVGVVTNITHEHLDYHKTYENYVKAKGKLLKRAKTAIVNLDDGSYNYLKQFVFTDSFSGKVVTYGIQNKADVTPQSFPFETQLTGEYNFYNVLAAIAVCQTLGISEEKIRKAVTSFTAPLGRQEIIYQGEFRVMIDFAHTPHAFEEVLSSLRLEVSGRIIHVFGAAGKRDITKRPLMGNVASRYDNVIILTAEDPRNERVEDIAAAIAKGFDTSWKEISKVKGMLENHQFITIPDRKKAIFFAIAHAQKNDVVLLTGKSHEKSMSYPGKEEPWDEYAAVTNALKNQGLL